MSDTPFVSIIVSAYNAEKTIRDCLKPLLKQDYPRDKYELIVVNDGSSDNTGVIAEKFADTVIRHTKRLGRSRARINAMKSARGEIIVNTDSDVILPHNALSKITNYFSEHKEISALTGLLSKEHLNSNFFSQYKNLYMNYIFRKLPERITFLYGSICAMRKEVAHLYELGFDGVEDTEFGQRLTGLGKKIAFLKDLRVVHLKKYTFFSFIVNDFLVPFNWVRIFLIHEGWRELFGRNKTGFAHSPKEQLLSIMVAPTILLLTLLVLLGYGLVPLILVLIATWLVLNVRFLAFLAKEKGLYFGILAIFVTFIDNVVMALGIMCGFTVALTRRLKGAQS